MSVALSTTLIVIGFVLFVFILSKIARIKPKYKAKPFNVKYAKRIKKFNKS